MNNKVNILMFIFILFLLTTGCKSYNNTLEVNDCTTGIGKSDFFSVEIQVGYFAENTHFYKISESGEIRYAKKDGAWGNLYNRNPKGFDYIDFNNTSGKVGHLSEESLKQFKTLLNDIVSEKSDYSAVDTPELHIYYNDSVFGCCILKDKNKYAKIDKLLDFLNENTSIELNRKIY